MNLYIRSFETAAAAQHVDFSGNCAVVIDILRATSTIITALENGCKQIVPVKTVEQVFALADEFPQALKAGERGGKKLPGFDLGNSPREYLPNVVNDRTIVFTTTNGTQALVHASSADEILIAAFLNLQTVADHLLASGKNIAIIQAGTEGQFTLEDAVCAGYLLKMLAVGNYLLDAVGEKALQLAEQYPEPLAALQDSRHGQNLVNLGFAPDLAVCAQLNSSQILPVYKGKLIFYK